jgi:hypothetical protein
MLVEFVILHYARKLFDFSKHLIANLNPCPKSLKTCL